MRSLFKPIVVSIFFASLLILSALLLKGKEAGYLVQGSIYMAWIYFFFSDKNAKRTCIIR